LLQGRSGRRRTNRRPAHPRRLDPEIQKALTFLPEAQALEDNADKVLTEKGEARKETPSAAAEQAGVSAPAQTPPRALGNQPSRLEPRPNPCPPAG